MSKFCLIAAFVVLAWATILGFTLLNDPSVEQFWPGWLSLAGLFYVGSKLT